jgi:hypothetical protein
VSNKQKKYLKIFTVVLVLIVGLHFVPVYSRRGHIGAKPDPVTGISSSLCIGYTNFSDRNYRAVLGGIGGFFDDKKNFHPSDNLYDTSASCNEPIILRLYIF